MPLNIEQVGKPTFVGIGGGALAIGHRPPLRALPAMKRQGLTHIATVLSREEDAEALGAATNRAGLAWLWIDLGSTKTLPQRRRSDIAEALRAMAAILDDGGSIYLHCSAGIHRTGMIAAALLFHLGRDEAQTKETLAALRPLTATDVGEARLEWARSFAGSS